MNVISRDNLSQRKLEGYLKMANIIQWGRRNPVKFVETFLGVEMMDYQKYTFMNSWTKQFVLWLMSRNGGKALSLDTTIPTPSGDKIMKDISVGDYVFGKDGKPTKVTNVSDVFINHDCYKVTFSDGEIVVADAEHLWSVSNINGRKPSYVFSTERMYKNGYIRNRKDGKGIEYFYRVPISEAVEYNKKDFEVDPYVLGLWLGDGNSRDTRITSHIDDYYEINELIKTKYNTSINNKSKNCRNINIGYKGKGKKNEFKEGLKKLNLIKNKHIPEEYLYGSVEQRLELLQGLMDTDGTCSKDKKTNQCSFCQKDYTFIKQVEKLISSLGMRNSLSTKKTTYNGKTFYSYSIYFYTDKNKPCFKMKRKYDLLPDKLSKRTKMKTIVSIEKINSIPTKCIMVDNVDHLFLCGNKYTVTHNSTLSAPFAMAKLLLFPNFESYILSLTAGQSQDTFLKMENIAKKQIESFTGLTDIFLGEVVKSSNHDGFVHSPQGFRFNLYNGSKITSLSGEENNIRGK